MRSTNSSTRSAWLGRLAASIAIALSGLAGAARRMGAPSGDTESPFRVLVFSKTAGYRHASIPDGIAAVQKLGREHGFEVIATEDPERFTDESLSACAVVVFLSTTGDVLDDTQQSAFERFVQRGGGFVGIHAASDTEYDWPWFGRLVGAYFLGHPAIQGATVLVVDRSHPSTAHLPERWPRRDEWYDYRENPRSRVRVLALLDERSYEGGRMGEDHPIAWCHLYDGGRSWYTGGGHTSESFTEEAFLQHLLGGILWTAGRLDGSANATTKPSPSPAVGAGDATAPRPKQQRP